jgi:hypothetical protein
LAEQLAQQALPPSPTDSDERRQLKVAFHRAAYAAGLLHDLGKYHEGFQQMIREVPTPREKTYHKVPGVSAFSAHPGGRKKH